MKVWAYGDSHTAGSELGCTVDHKAWLKNNHADKWNQYLIDTKQYSTLIGDSNIACSPELSWAGRLAKKLNAEYICRALPGWSNDGCLKLMLEDRNKWKNNDLILWGITTPVRFRPAGKHLSNHQPARWPTKVAKIWFDYGPHEESTRLYNQGMMLFFKRLHKNTMCVRMNNDDISVDNVYFDDVLQTKTSLLDWQQKGNYSVLPNTHYSRECHNDYAEMIYNTLGDKNG